MTTRAMLMVYKKFNVGLNGNGTVYKCLGVTECSVCWRQFEAEAEVVYIDYKVGEASSCAVMSCLRELTARTRPSPDESEVCCRVHPLHIHNRQCRPPLDVGRPLARRPPSDEPSPRTDQCGGLERDSHCPTETSLTSPAHQPDKRQDDGSSRA